MVMENLSGKSIHQETQDVDSYEGMIEGFYGSVDKAGQGEHSGAILMGVCRGRLSEGLDFKDRKARCVIIVGIPFPALNEPKIILKRYYLDKRRELLGRISES